MIDLAELCRALIERGPRKVFVRSYRLSGKTRAAAQLRAEYPEWHVFDDGDIEGFIDAPAPAIALCTPRDEETDAALAEASDQCFNVLANVPAKDPTKVACNL